MTLLAFLLPFFFILYPSRMWNFDGVACAAALELGNPIYFFHSNHLLYGFLGYLFWKPLSFWALPRALPALQLFTSLLSAGGLIGLYKLLGNILDEPRQALALTLCIAVSAVVWVWSIEAQVYALGFLALTWATYELLGPEHPHQWARVATLHAAAILGHIVHVLWIVPAIYWMRREAPATRQRHLRQYLRPLLLLTVTPYLLVMAFFMMLTRGDAHGMMRWLMGSAALNPNSIFQWHFAGWMAPFQWAFVTPRIFWGAFWPYAMSIPLWASALTVISIAGVILLIVLSWKQHTDRLWIFSALWLAVYGVFFWTWEPRTECYRMTDVIPLAILLSIGLMQLQKAHWRWGTLGLLFLTLGGVNFYTRISPMNDERRNGLYQATISLEKATPADSLYLTTGGAPWLYILYFVHRSAWNLNSLLRDPHHLASEIARHAATQPVYISVDALQLNGIRPWISKYTLVPVGQGLPWVRLQ